MKTGDLVKMKDIMWWRLMDRKDYTREVRIVTQKDYNAILLLCSDGMIRRYLADHWEVVNEGT